MGSTDRNASGDRYSNTSLNTSSGAAGDVIVAFSEDAAGKDAADGCRAGNFKLPSTMLQLLSNIHRVPKLATPLHADKSVYCKIVNT